MTTVAYVRVSGQQAETSIERQTEVLKAYAIANGLGTVEVLADVAVSGFKTLRPGFQKLRRMVEARQVSCVLVNDLSRLSRSIKDTYEFIEVVEKVGCRLVILNMQVDTASAIGRAFLMIAAVFAQLYRDDISERRKKSRIYLDSVARFAGGTVPYGYVIGPERSLVPEPEEQKVIAWCQAMRLVGMKVYQLADQLNEMGVPSKTGKPWSRQAVGKIISRDQNPSAA